MLPAGVVMLCAAVMSFGSSQRQSCTSMCTVLCYAVLLLRCTLSWEPCSDVLHYTHTVGSMIPVHLELQEAGVRGLVLSGRWQQLVQLCQTPRTNHCM